MHKIRLNFQKLMPYLLIFFRFKYLEKMHEEEMSKILVYLKGFTEDERLRLAQITALWLVSGQIPATTLRTLINVIIFIRLPTLKIGGLIGLLFNFVIF